MKYSIYYRRAEDSDWSYYGDALNAATAMESMVYHRLNPTIAVRIVRADKIETSQKTKGLGQ